LFTLLLFSRFAPADVNRWTWIGPDSGDQWIRCIAVDPTSTNTLYAGSNDGVVKTSDGGGTWSRTELGSVWAIAIDTSSPSTVYAGTTNGMSKTNDAGTTWTPINSGLGFFAVLWVTAIGIDPSNPATLYAGTYSSGVFKSRNGGASWTEMNSGFPRDDFFNTRTRIFTLVVDPSTSSTVYAGTFEGVFKSTNGGASWTAMTEGMRVSSDPLSVSSLAIDPSAPSTLYAGNEGHGVYKSTNGAASWSPLPRPKGVPAFYAFNVTALAIDPVSPQTLYASVRYNNPFDFGVIRTTDGGASWTPLSDGLPDFAELLALAVSPSSPSTVYAGGYNLGLYEITLVEPCAASATTLCLNNSRFRVEVSWRAANLGTSGLGRAVALTSDTGQFWFFSENNIELVVKVVDGRAFNNHFWVFYGALSDVEYTITVTDTETGIGKSYFNPQGQLASIADTSAFAATGAGPSPSSESLPRTLRSAKTAVCSGDTTALCLNAGRFRVQVAWRAANIGSSGVGQAQPLTGDTGYFWFFSANNVELIIKVVDGRSFNGRFWVFYGALSDVEYTITVTDTDTLAERTYSNPQGQLASVADTAAF
jgi:hypothetical protein